MCLRYDTGHHPGRKVQLCVYNASKKIVICIFNLETEVKSPWNICLSTLNLQMSGADDKTVLAVQQFYTKPISSGESLRFVGMENYGSSSIQLVFRGESIIWNIKKGEPKHSILRPIIKITWHCRLLKSEMENASIYKKADHSETLF